MLSCTSDSFRCLYEAALEVFSLTKNFPMSLLYKAGCFIKSLYHQVVCFLGFFFCYILSIKKT